MYDHLWYIKENLRRDKITTAFNYCSRTLLVNYMKITHII